MTRTVDERDEANGSARASQRVWAAMRKAAGSRLVIGCVGLTALGLYALLKAAWAAGSRVGIVDVAAWDRAFGQLNEFERWAALWGTDLLALGGGLVLLAVLADRATPFGRAPLRGVVWASSGIAAVLLGVFALAALGSTVLADVQVSRGEADPSPMAAWVYYGVYSCFLAYALALGAATRTSPRGP